MFSKTKLQWKFIVAFTRHTSAAIDLILQDMPLHTRTRMKLMHDGAPSHYNSDVGTSLNDEYPQRGSVEADQLHGLHDHLT